jgi:hypothetical protein
VPSHRGTEGNETAYQLARVGFECPFIGPEPALGILAGIAKKAVRDRINRNHKEYNQTCKGFPTRTLCQKKHRTVKTELKPVTVGDSTTYRTLSPERNTFKMGLTNNPTCESCLEKDESATHILCDCESVAYLSFCHLGHYFMEPGDYQDTPLSKILHFIRSVGLLRG